MMYVVFQMQSILEKAQKKNRTLATWTKERVDQLSQLVGSWDNFQTLLHNQQYMITKQVFTQHYLYLHVNYFKYTLIQSYKYCD